SLDLSLLFFFFHSSAHHRPLHSFPTRRSSDLNGPTAAAIAPAAPIIAKTLACSLPSKLPWMSDCIAGRYNAAPSPPTNAQNTMRSEEHTSELQSQSNLVCRLLLEKKKKNNKHE